MGQGAISIDRMAFSPDSTLVAACSRLGVVRVWEVGTGRERHAWNTGGLRVTRIAFSPDGRLLAGAGQGLWLFDPAAGAMSLAPGR
jgi:WD40 repeat protein